MILNMTNEKQLLHHSRFPDSGGPLDFVLPGNVEFALLSNIVYRECVSEFKRKSQAFKLNFPLTRTRTVTWYGRLHDPGRIPCIHGCEGVGISLIMGRRRTYNLNCFVKLSKLLFSFNNDARQRIFSLARLHKYPGNSGVGIKKTS